MEDTLLLQFLSFDIYYLW